MNETIPYVRGSETSEDAAHAKRATAGSDEERVLEAIRRCGADGITDDGIENLLEMRHQNASARRNALVRKGLVCDSGMKRNTRSGRRATVWVAGVGSPLVGAPNDRVKRPSRDELLFAAAVLEKHVGTDVAKWLRWMARH
jgi:hypothetical protein